VAAVKQAVRRGVWGWLLPLVLGLLLAGGAVQAAEKMPQRALRADADAAAALDDDGNARVIVKYRSGSALAADLAASRRGAVRLGGRLQLALQDGHVLGARSQSLRARGISPQALAARLAADGDVEWVQPVRRKTINAVVPPSDPLFGDNQTTATPAAGQWYLRAPDATLVSAINAVGAWAITTGSASVTVAVIDTGVRTDHPDLQGKLWPGYDFVSNNTTANDAQSGRDADPSDPGDWNPTATTRCPVSNSSWHGTQVAGLIGAATDNGIGIAGTGRDTMVLPVRVLGRCGGFDDDIIAGMRWAAGLSNATGCSSGSAVSATCNPHPARVLNLSLGSTGTCSNAYAQAITELNAAGVTVVVASGNDTGHAVNEPANCTGALAVAGVRHAGTKVGYSNIGPQVAIAAPAGNCVNDTGLCLYPLVTTDNSGTTTPGTNVYSSGISPSLGTSFATPIVAASAALLLAVDPTLTPALIRSTLQATARSFPTAGAQEPTAVACRAPDATDQVECYCTTSTCGAGMLDVAAAVAQAAGTTAPPVAVIAAAHAMASGTSIVLDGGPSSRNTGTYQWLITDGAGLGQLGGSVGPRTTLTMNGSGTVTVRLTVTDGAGNSASGSTVLTQPPDLSIGVSNAAPVAGDDIHLTGSIGTHGGRRVLSQNWTVISGGTHVQISGASNGPSLVLNTLSAGDVTVQLTVVDSGLGITTSNAVLRVGAATVAVIGASNSTPTVGDTISMSGTGSSAATGRAITGYRWAITSGAGLASLIGATDGSTVSLATSGAGTVVVQLTVTDNTGASRSSSQTITVAAAPVVVTPAGSGGGGAVQAGWLLGLAAAVLLLWRGRPGRRRARG